jgi:mRNA-degrading endonuclease toxin of MazEF toxin-antitoxin module
VERNDVPKLAQGQIVLVDVPDPQGRNRKIRPVIVVTPSDEIVANELVVAVAITGTLPKKLPADHVLLPYHNDGHPRTGLRRRCAAVCSWLIEFHPEDVKEVKGVTPKKELAEILDKISRETQP